MFEGKTTIKDLVGKTITSITKTKDEIIFKINEETSYKMYHEQEWSESVEIEDINGDLDDLLNTPILLAEERTDTGEVKDWIDTFTWTFYTIRTIKGTVVIRWYGTSNGYYSEEVSIRCINTNDLND